MYIKPLLILFVLVLAACAPMMKQGYVSSHGENKAESRDEKMKKEKKDPGLISESPAIDLSRLDTLGSIIPRVMEKRIIYVGEYHDRFSHHDVQLEVIKAVYAMDRRLAIGMEMFQRRFQKALDEYIAGLITEREFLKKSEYFKRWGFDYNLYKPIIDFCRENKIPIVALNARREIIQKIARTGIESLSEDERREIPPDMDFSDEDYRARLKDVFDKHSDPESKSFDFFYQAQITWDETMAASVDEFLKNNPDYRMVVLAGSGHLAHGSGIPKRVFRRNGLAYSIILNDSDVEMGIADYLVFPKARDVEAARLDVSLKEAEGKVVISGFGEDSPAKKAGLKKGDRIIFIDDETIGELQDIKISLLYKKKGDIVRVGILRDRFLFGEREMVFEFKL